MQIACLDLEGVLVPEIWIAFAEHTGIAELRATTRDVPDYDELMRQRLRILAQHDLRLPDIQNVIAQLRPLEGANEFLAWLRTQFQVVILSDTYYEFALPLMRQLGDPTLLCHRLETDAQGRVLNYRLRMSEQKRAAVKAFHQLNYRVAAAGDSYNDTGMLSEADIGILFRPPESLTSAFPQFQVTRNYDELRVKLAEARMILNPGTPKNVDAA
jgi:phosphoserine/homoserine phosphotransferase